MDAVGLVSTVVDKPIYCLCKRCIDFTLSILVLFVLSPLLLLTAILIKLDTPGPVLFVHERVGSRRRSVNGRAIWEIHTFRVYKFRSMVHNADQTLHQAQAQAYVRGGAQLPDPHTGSAKIARDPRITRVGRVIRATSLDEFPQLLNVLKGEMGLVGPRPVPVYEFAEYDEWHKERLATLPGITGWWQVKGRGRTSFEEQMRMDIEYVRNQSLWLDIKILFLTVPAVLRGKGAE